MLAKFSSVRPVTTCRCRPRDRLQRLPYAVARALLHPNVIRSKGWGFWKWKLCGVCGPREWVHIGHRYNRILYTECLVFLFFSREKKKTRLSICLCVMWHHTLGICRKTATPRMTSHCTMYAAHSTHDITLYNVCHHTHTKNFEGLAHPNVVPTQSSYDFYRPTLYIILSPLCAHACRLREYSMLSISNVLYHYMYPLLFPTLVYDLTCEVRHARLRTRRGKRSKIIKNNQINRNQ